MIFRELCKVLVVILTFLYLENSKRPFSSVFFLTSFFVLFIFFFSALILLLSCHLQLKE